MEATAALVAERGYLGFAIVDLIKRARVSHATVLNLYGGKRDCYLAVIDQTLAELERSYGEVTSAEAETQESRMSAVVETTLRQVATDPVAARAFLVEAFAVGSAGVERLRAALAMIGAAVRGEAVAQGEGRLSDEAAGAAVLWLPIGHLLDGTAEQVEELAEAITGHVLALPAESRPRSGGASRAEHRTEISSAEGASDAPLGPLPAGHHKLPRGAVEHSQRERLLAGVVDAVAGREFAKTRVSDVVARAAVSRRVFYEQFESLEECFLCAVEIVAGHLGEVAAQAAAAAEGGPRERASAALGAVLDFLADEPDLARACMVESLAAGAAGQRRYRDSVERAAGTLRTSLAVESGSPSSMEAAQMAVGSVAMVVSLRIAEGRVEDLPSLEPELVELLLGPLTESR